MRALKWKPLASVSNKGTQMRVANFLFVFGYLMLVSVTLAPIISSCAMRMVHN